LVKALVILVALEFATLPLAAQTDLQPSVSAPIEPSDPGQVSPTPEVETAIPADQPRQLRIFTNSVANVLPKYVDGSNTLGGSVIADVSGLVGIGTMGPTQTLHVFGSGDGSLAIEAENPNGTGTGAAAVLRTRANAAVTSYISHGSARTLQRFGQTLGGWSEILTFGGNGLIVGTQPSIPILFGTNLIERMRIHANGDVAIGSTTDQGKLFVLGTADNGRAFYTQQNSAVESSATQWDYGFQSDAFDSVSPGATNSGGITGAFIAGWNRGTLPSAPDFSGTVTYATGGRFVAGNYWTATAGTVVNAYAIQAQVSRGTGAASVTNGYGVRIENIDATNDWGVYQVDASDDNYFAGRVGVGTTAPQDALHITAPSDFGIRMTHTDPNSPRNAISFYEGANLMGFINQRGSTFSTEGQMRRFNIGNNDPAGATGLYAGGVQRMIIAANGNVGVGTTSPAAKLDVAGSVQVVGTGIVLHVVGNSQFDGTVRGTNIQAHYQDVAEWVPAGDELQPGMVVVLDRKTANTVVASTKAYDPAVAGVVSPQPGIVLGEESDTKELVATTGRVRVRVDASRGAIAIGDLLATSDIPGTAMKSMPVELGGIQMHRPGTIVGKALEPLDHGTGEILVLLSLQ
jgi:hypothetical protein